MEEIRNPGAREARRAEYSKVKERTNKAHKQNSREEKYTDGDHRTTKKIQEKMKKTKKTSPEDKEIHLTHMSRPAFLDDSGYQAHQRRERSPGVPEDAHSFECCKVSHAAGACTAT